MKLKNVLFLMSIMLVLTLSSCSTKESKFLKSAEKYCISQLDNPKSYSLDSISIVDTLTEYQVKLSAIKHSIDTTHMKISIDSLYINISKQRIESCKSSIKEYSEKYAAIKKSVDFKDLIEYEESLIKKYATEIKKRAEEMDAYKSIINDFKTDLNNQLKIKDNNVIVEIEIYIAFRASNKFGAIVKNDEYITYTPTGGFEMEL
jgi:DNA repair ATPase RecN